MAVESSRSSQTAKAALPCRVRVAEPPKRPINNHSSEMTVGLSLPVARSMSPNQSRKNFGFYESRLNSGENRSPECR